MLSKFEQGHNAMKAAKNIGCVEAEGTVDHFTVSRWWKEFCSVGKKLDDQTIWDRPKTGFQSHTPSYQDWQGALEEY